MSQVCKCLNLVGKFLHGLLKSFEDLCDRKSASDGGALMYVHTSLHGVTCESLTHLHVEESVWCSVTVP